MASTSDSASIISCPKEYETSDWGTTLSESDVWEGPMAELLTKREDIKETYTTTQLVPTKAGHGRLTAKKIFAADSSGSGPGQNPSDAITIEVEWVELRLPVEKNPCFTGKLTPEEKTVIRRAASAGDKFSDIKGLPTSTIGGAWAKLLYNLVAEGTTDYSIGVPVVRKTTKNAFSLTNGAAWVRSTPPVVIEGYQWLKTADRRVRVGSDIQKVEEWTGAKTWEPNLYP